MAKGTSLGSPWVGFGRETLPPEGPKRGPRSGLFSGLRGQTHFPWFGGTHSTSLGDLTPVTLHIYTMRYSRYIALGGSFMYMGVVAKNRGLWSSGIKD
jgi:hypothetical protein